MAGSGSISRSVYREEVWDSPPAAAGRLHSEVSRQVQKQPTLHPRCLPHKIQTRGQWERRRQDTGRGRVGARGELVPGPSGRCTNTAAGRRPRPGLRARVSASPAALRTPKANDSRISPGGSAGGGGLAGGGGESGTCASRLRGWLGREVTPFPASPLQLGCGVRKGRAVGERGPSRRRGGAGTPLPPEAPRRPPPGEGGWPRALRSPFPLRPPRADGFRDFRDGGGWRPQPGPRRWPGCCVPGVGAAGLGRGGGTRCEPFAGQQFCSSRAQERPCRCARAFFRLKGVYLRVCFGIAPRGETSSGGGGRSEAFPPGGESVGVTGQMGSLSTLRQPRPPTASRRAFSKEPRGLIGQAQTSLGL